VDPSAWGILPHEGFLTGLEGRASRWKERGVEPQRRLVLLRVIRV